MSSLRPRARTLAWASRGHELRPTVSNKQWSRIRKQRLSRRSVLRASARAGVGAAGFALVGCGGDDDSDDQPQAVAEQQAQQEQQQQAMQEEQQQEVVQEQAQQQAMQQQQQQEAAQPQPAAQEEQAQQQVQQQAQQQQEQVAEAEDADEQKRGGTLRLGIVGSPANFSAPYSADIVFGQAVWDSLTKYGPEGLTPQPHLAESWEFNDDQTIMTITLRAGQEFHDGKPMTAEEVKKSLERMDDEDVANSQVRSIFNTFVSGITAIDETTLQFDLAWPGEVIFDALQFANIHDADAIPGLEGYTQVNASGAFEFDTDSYQIDVYARADRVDNYYDPAFLDSLEWHSFQDADSMTLALRGGELDMIYDLPKSQYASFAEDDDFGVELAPPTNLLWVMGMVGTGRGGGHPLLDDPRVRQALYRVIDRKRITEELFEGLSDAKNVIWPEFSPGYDASLDRDYFDVEEARQLITEAGYPDGTPTLPVASIGFQQEAVQMAQIIQQDAALAGINIEPVSMEFSTWLDNFLAGTHEAMYMALFSFYAMNPQSLPLMNFQMRVPNSCAYDSPEYQAMINGWPTADSEAKRQALLDEFNRILDEEPWIAPICTTVTTWAYQEHVKGFWQDVLGRPRFQDVYFDNT